MKAFARRIEGYANDVEIEGGHTLRVDEPAAAGGTDTGPSPTRLVAAGLAGCVAATMEMYADRKSWEIGPVEVEVEVSYRDHVPLSFTVTVRLAAELSEEQRERLLLVARKCPVHKLIADETEVVIADEVEPLR